MSTTVNTTVSNAPDKTVWSVLGTALGWTVGKLLRKTGGFLFPWRITYRRLGLEKRWLHRLAVVAFVVTLIPIFSYAWILGDEATSSANPYRQEIHHWSALPDGTLIEFDDSSRSSDNTATSSTPPPIAQKTVEMPDGNYVSFPGTMSDDAINTQWGRASVRATEKAQFYGFGVALLVTLIFSYLLQAAHRVVLYVVYGAKAGVVAADTE